jgi:hypothetical protein
MSASGQYQYVNLSAGGIIYYSHDFGVTWNASIGSPSGIWYDVCCDSTGAIVYANAPGGIYKSTDFGVNFALIFVGGIANWNGVGCSGDGKYVIACHGNATAYLNWLSGDYGATFAQFGPAVAAGESHAALSYDGKYQYVLKLGLVYKSSDYGVTWDAGTLLQAGNANAICTDDSGKYVLEYTGNLDIFTSNDFGVTYRNNGFRLNNSGCCAMSRNGKIQVFTGYDTNNGYVFLSDDYGRSFRAMAPPQITRGIAVSQDGKYITKATQTTSIGGGYIYLKRW